MSTPHDGEGSHDSGPDAAKRGRHAMPDLTEPSHPAHHGDRPANVTGK